MTLIIKVAPTMAREIRQTTTPHPDAQQVVALVAAFGGELHSMHPGQEATALGGYFSITLPDAKQAAELAQQLRALPNVEMAYSKPADALPGVG